MPHAAMLSVVAAASVACGGGPRARVVASLDRNDVDGALNAYDDFRSSDGADVDLLARVAGLILRAEVESDDETRRRAALTQLSLAGTAGVSMLRDLGAQEGLSPARLGALVVLARRGETDAALALRALADSDDPEVLSASTFGMDPVEDQRLLLGYLSSNHAALRAAAAGRLRSVAGEPEVRRALSDAARVDPESEVRAAAVRALAGAGSDAISALRERLGDPASSVRLAAVGALVEADASAAFTVLGTLLEVPPSPAGIEAARLLLQDALNRARPAEESDTESHQAAPQSEPARLASAFLERALSADDASLRAQAGVALAGLPRGAAPLSVLRQALERERDASVRLALARAMLAGEPAFAAQALEQLSQLDSLAGVHAAALLASVGRGGADARLMGVLRQTSAGSVLRRTAARALARDAMKPDAVRGALRDDDPMVRIFAAGGILAAAAAS